MWKVVTSSNLNSLLKLFFYSLILANNNLLLKIYCKNIVVAFLNCIFHFFLSIIRFLFFFFFFFLFFSLNFSPPHMYTHYLQPLLFLFSPLSTSFQNLPPSFFLQHFVRSSRSTFLFFLFFSSSTQARALSHT